MEEEPIEGLPDHRGSGEANSSSDIRDLWTTTSLSESQQNLPLFKVCENFDEEGIYVDKTQWYKQTRVWEDDEEDESHSFPEEPQEGSSTEPPAGKKGDSSRSKAEKRHSMSSVEGSRHAPHLAYWAEQQNRLPLPLRELMKNEALEILNKTLRSESLQPSTKDPGGFCRA
nr:testis-expressed sequence 40 protein isoform X2 [Microcebus murinus]